MFIIIILGGVLFNLNFYFNWLSLFLCLYFFINWNDGGAWSVTPSYIQRSSSDKRSSNHTLCCYDLLFGSIFSNRILPKSIRWISNLLPVKYVTDLIRFSGNIKQITLNNFIVINLVLFISGSVLMFISSKVFLKEEK